MLRCSVDEDQGNAKQALVGNLPHEEGGDVGPQNDALEPFVGLGEDTAPPSPWTICQQILAMLPMELTS